MEAPLPTIFQVGPWRHEQVHRDGDLAIYRRWKHGETGRQIAVHYEVVRIVHQAENLSPNGIMYAAKELYPHVNAWGKRGWTYKTLPEALTKLQRLNATPEDPPS